MQVSFNTRFEFSTKKRGFVAKFDLNDWAISLVNSKTNAVKTLSFGPFHLTYINYEKMNESINEMIAMFNVSEEDPDQYIMSEFEDINNLSNLKIPKTLN